MDRDGTRRGAGRPGARWAWFLAAAATLLLGAGAARAVDHSTSLEEYLVTQSFGGLRPTAATCSDHGGDRYVCILTFRGHPFEFSVAIRGGRTVDAAPSPTQRALCRQAIPDIKAFTAAIAGETGRTGAAVAAFARMAAQGHVDTPRLRALVGRNAVALRRLAARAAALRVHSDWGRRYRATLVSTSDAQARAGSGYRSGRVGFRAWTADVARQDAILERVRLGAPCLPSAG